MKNKLRKGGIENEMIITRPVRIKLRMQKFRKLALAMHNEMLSQARKPATQESRVFLYPF